MFTLLKALHHDNALENPKIILNKMGTYSLVWLKSTLGVSVSAN